MTTEVNEYDELEQRLSGWLRAAAPAPAPDLERRILARTALTTQRRARRWWTPAVPVLGAAAAAVILVVVVRLASLAPPPFASPSLLPTPTSSTSPSPSHVATPSLEGSPSVRPSPTPGPTAPPSPSPEATPSGTPAPWADWPRCRNDVDGYTLSYPEDWFTNAAVDPEGDSDGLPACIAFGRDPVEVIPHSDFVHPAQVIGIYSYRRESPHFGEVLVDQETIVDGRPASIIEYRIPDDFTGMEVPGARIYRYTISLETGGVLEVRTDTVTGEGYAGDKRILDLMMQTLRFDP